MSRQSPLITQAVVDAAMQRARAERAKAVQAFFAAVAQAFRRLAASGPVQAVSTAAR